MLSCESGGGQTVSRRLPALRHCLVLALCVLLGLSLSGCAGLGRLDQARKLYYNGQPDAALAALDSRSVGSRNRLLGRLDAGLIAHMDGQYARSRDAFFEAVAIIDQLDKVSVSEQTTALVVNDWATSYRGEYSERLWIHTFQMMNFLLLDDPQGAAVEARQALQLFEQYGQSLRDDWFTRTLIATSFAAAGQYDSAHIEYAKLIDDLPPAYGIGYQASLNALRAGRFDAAKRYAPGVSAAAARADGELVVFVSQGQMMRKVAGDLLVPPSTRLSFPFYPERIAGPVAVQASVDGRPAYSPSSSGSGPGVRVDVVATELVNVARSSLDARGKALAARQALRAGTKYQISRAAGRQNEVLGAAVTAVMFLLEQADTRSWETLPASLAMIRLALPPGRHDLAFTVDDGRSLHQFSLEDVSVATGRTTFRRYALGR